MDEEKDKIVEGAKQYAEYIVSQLPQKSEKGDVKYYFSGSLAMLLLSSAKTFKPMEINADGKLNIEGQIIEIPNENKANLFKGVRPIGFGSSHPDLDVIVIDTNDTSLNFVRLSRFPQNNEFQFASELCPTWNKGLQYLNLDNLECDREFSSYNVAELTMLDGTSIFVADPLSLAVHKFADSIKCKTVLANFKGKGLSPDKEAQKEAQFNNKYKRDISDFSSMFAGVASLYQNIDFGLVIKHIMESCPDTALISVMEGDNEELFNQFMIDVKEQLDDKNQVLLDDFIKSVKIENKNLTNSKKENLSEEDTASL